MVTTSKKKIILVVALAIIVLVSILYYIFIWQNRGWKTLSGCISYENKNYEYTLQGKRNWFLVNKDMGCDTDNGIAQTWGLLKQKVGKKKLNIGQISVLVSIVKPTSPDSNSFKYIALPDKEIYVELGRINSTIEGKNFKITDEQWQEIKNSFQFK